MGAAVRGDAGRQSWQAYQETLLLGILEPSMKLTKVTLININKPYQGDGKHHKRAKKSNERETAFLSNRLAHPGTGMPERFSMAFEALSLNIDLSGQFRKLLFDRCDADVSAAALAAIAANGTEAELRLEDRILPIRM